MDRTLSIDSDEDQPRHGRSESAGILRLLCAFAIESLRVTEEWSTVHGIHHTDARAMAVLDESVRSGTLMTVGRLGASLGLSSPATSALISRLEEAGYVLRTRDPADRRRVLLTLSPSANRSAVEYFQPLGDAVRSVLAGSTDKDQRVIAHFLQDLVAHMRAIPRE